MRLDLAEIEEVVAVVDSKNEQLKALQQHIQSDSH